jgi:YggT family protein
MAAIIGFIFFIVGSLLQLLIWAIIISAILSWLVAFNVINIRHPFAYNVVRFLDAVTRPVLRPFQRIIPPLGGVDISPIVAILVLIGIQRYLLPALASFLLGVVAF